MSYVNLHTHSDYSLLDGASQLPQLIERAAELGMPAIALTDHGVMYGALQLIKLCRNKNIKAIIGNEMYVVNGDLEDKKTKRKKYHQIVLAKNTEGYKNLVKLTTVSHLDGFQGKGIFGRPCINKEYLEKHGEGLIVTSGCMAGEVPQNILKGEIDEARKVAKWYKKIFGEDYYLEIQDHGYPADRIINVAIVKIAKELGIKIIATNDSHFTNCQDVDAHDALLCINTQKLITEEKRMRYSGTEYLKSAAEMKMLFRDHLEDEVIEEAIANTLEVAEKIKTYDLFGDTRIPNYPIPSGHNPVTYLEEVTWEGLQERLKVKSKQDVSRQHPEYEERLKYELSTIDKMGFSTYFLVVWDYIKFARDNNIPVGPGRGSAAGSLVAYALKITNIDPVHHGLLFERFLNPERKSMPDIDTDFSIDRRDDMIKYVTEKYGVDKVAQIVTFNRMTSKAVLKDVARVLGVPYGEADKMAKLIPVSRGKPTKLKVMVSDETPTPEFKEAYDNKTVPITDSKGEPAGVVSVRQWIDMAITIEGTNRTFGVHAAGVLISKDPLDEIVPLQRNNDGAVITQYFMEDLEALGLLKMDFLGLKNLTIIQNATKAIYQNHKHSINAETLPADERKAMEIVAKIKKLPEDVENTYKLIASGDLEGVFQLESSGMMDIVRKLKPSSIEDISSILALYRPGPLDAGLIPKFIDRKHGREEIRYDHVLLEPILNETYGVLCLPKGTLIDKPDGSMVAIENVRKGDTILTSNGSRVWEAKVAKQWRSGVKEILKIVLSSGTVIFAGKNHRFLTPEGDKFAWELKGAADGSEVYEKWPVSSGKKKLRQNEAYLLGLLKELPENVLDYSEQDRRDLLRGLWEGENVERASCLFLSSPQFLERVGKLLASLKIAYSLGGDYLVVSDKSRFLSALKSGGGAGLQNSIHPPKTHPLNQLKNPLPTNLVRPSKTHPLNPLKNPLPTNLVRPSKTHPLNPLKNPLPNLPDARLVYVVSVEEAGEAECFDLEMEDQSSPYFLAQGVVVHNCYQEQIMKMAQDLAGYSLGEADLLRRAISKKKVAEMEKHREKFIDGAAKKGVSSKIAQNLFEQMIKFAEYCFNKSHSTAYAYVSYQTAYLKANYPVEYMAALLTANSGDQDKVQKYIANCQRFNIEVEPPDINRSKVDFTPLPKSASGDGKGRILFGLSAVKNLGDGAIMEILKAREEKGPFVCLADLCDRVSQQAINSRGLESLIYCGAFDKLEPNRQKLIKELPDIIAWAQKRNRDRDSGQLNLFDLGIGGAAESENAFETVPQKTGIVDFSAQEKLKKEKELLGFYVSDHPLKCILQTNPVEDAITIAQLKDKEKKTKGAVKVVAMVAGQKLHTTKKGDRMAFLQIEDMSGQMEAIIFPKTFEEVGPLLDEVGTVLLLTGKAETKDDEVQLLVEEAKRIQEEMADAVENSSPINIEGEEKEEEEEAIAPATPAAVEMPPEKIEEEEIETPSEHPAKLARRGRGDVVLVESLEDKPEKVSVRAIGKLTRVKVITTKNGDEMAFLEIEDETGKVDVTVFPSTYNRFKHLLEEEEEETLLLVTGKTEKREGRVKLTADKLELVAAEESSPMPSPPEEHFPKTYSPSSPPPSQTVAAETSMSIMREMAIVLQLTPQQVADGELMRNLQMVLEEYAAPEGRALVPVMAMVAGKSCRQLVRFDRRFWVEDVQVVERLRGHNFNVGVSRG
jgi:DNA-directed DNA polymerase III PolC